MENSYCGLRCNQCIYKTQGKCCGCKPEVENTYLLSLHREIEPDADMQMADNSDVVPEESKTRYSAYCPIAMCCKNKEYENCFLCDKRYTCQDYNNKGAMCRVIESKLDLWGVTSHGLRDSVKYQWFLLVCYIFLILPSIMTKLFSTPLLALIYIPLSGIAIYGYSKMIPYSHIFRVTILFTAGDMLVHFLVDIIDYGSLVNLALSAFGMVISVINYKITFDAYADMVSDVDDRLEKSWLRIWPLTVFLYIACGVVILFTFTLEFAIAPPIILNILIIVNMIRTIDVSKVN